ncbi:MAG: polyprenyl synthetase family protein [Chloroherpetonaceae bacterium]|nr:polyprenyl synthetase family protein [Chthonomonadaceae bacterium]MDW8208247.1 polyprenyl synthetase family protein [Chloroherpetonaceae bacterium]
MSHTTHPAATGRPVAPREPSRRAIAFLEYVRPDLEAIEDRLNTELGSDVRSVYDLSRYVLHAGGKRLRPAMVALSARAVNADPDAARIATVGAAVELVHMATLIHDDVVDNTATRRGKPTANAVFGNGVAVLCGDYILARAMRLLAVDGDLRVIRTVSDITIEMSEGEVMEIAATGRSTLSLAEYLEILRKKTATFVEGCCRCGAILGNAEEPIESCLAQYGYHLGMAFQLADDLLDYIGDPHITGKPCGSDLREGRATMPFLLALDRAGRQEREQLIAAFGNPELPDQEFVAVRDILSRYGTFDQTRDTARQHVEKASEALCLLPPSMARDCFSLLTEYVVERDR